MLADSVLKQLVCYGAGPLQELLVTTAWPSLSVESKLQVLDAMFPPGKLSWTASGWIAKLALRDEHPIVRFWCARSVEPSRYLPPEGRKTDWDREDRAAYELITGDESELVRLTQYWLQSFRFDGLEDYPQIGRLLALRHVRGTSFQVFMQWLAKMVNAGPVTDRELAECATEFLRREDVQTMLNDKSRYRGDFSSWEDEQHLKPSWQVAASAGPALMGALASHLPVEIGGQRLVVDDLLQFNAPLLETLVYRTDAELFRELRKHILAAKEKFDEAIVKSCQDMQEQERGRPPTPEALAAGHRQHRERVDAASLETESRVQNIERTLQQQSAVNEERFRILFQMLERKRGIFG